VQFAGLRKVVGDNFRGDTAASGQITAERVGSATVQATPLVA
jgi:hypothetical protein